MPSLHVNIDVMVSRTHIVVVMSIFLCLSMQIPDSSVERAKHRKVSHGTMEISIELPSRVEDLALHMLGLVGALARAYLPLHLGQAMLLDRAANSVIVFTQDANAGSALPCRCVSLCGLHCLSSNVSAQGINWSNAPRVSRDKNHSPRAIPTPSGSDNALAPLGPI
jgi:hypothetical protein